MPRKKLPQIKNIEIQGFASDGKCLTRHENQVIFIPGNQAAPGDVVDLQISKKKKNYSEAFVTQHHHFSDVRTEPFCAHFGTCGGCKWQHLPYEIQLQFKQKEVEDNLNRIGKVALPEIPAILPSPETQYYRNKLEFAFASQGWLTKAEIAADEMIEKLPALGFHVPKFFDKILNINHCYLQAEPSNPIRNKIRDFCIQQGYTFYHPRSQEGFLRNLLIRTTNTGELMVVLIVRDKEPEKIKAILEFTQAEFPEITSLQYIINPKQNDTFHDLPVHLFAGESFIHEKMEDLTFRIGVKTFYQTNSQQAYELYKVARDFANLQGSEVVYDLYTGAGTIALFLAKQAKHIFGIEYVEDAIADAKVNAELNQVSNTSFFAGDMKKVLDTDFIQKHGKPEIIITDPPRAGMHPDVVKVLLDIEPQRIVYVSCNVATQARDLAMLSEKYQVKAVQPVDMFPHTHHVENVVKLERIAE